MWAGALAFLLPLALYAVTRAPDLTFIDAGELAAVASTLGIAHPTGYPLFTILGRLVTAAPGPLEPLARLSLLSALCGAAAAALISIATRRILVASGKRQDIANFGGLAAGLLLAAGRTAWRQSVIVEVYALHLLLLAALFYLALLATDATRGTEARGRSLALLAYVAGLAIGNHLSAALLLPALAYLIAREQDAAWLLRSLPRLILVFLIGLSIYTYLPVRSATDPLLDWGDPETPGNLFRHATGAVYRVWFLSSLTVATKQLGRFLELLPWEMTPLALIAAAAGLSVLWRRTPRLAHTTILLVVLNLLYAINYDIHDIDSYFLPTFLVVAVWAGIGVSSGAELIAHRFPTPLARCASLALTLALPFCALLWNAGSASQRGNFLVADYTRAMFDSLEPRAVILSRQWDHFCSAAIYEQLVRGKRPDVTVLEKELLRRSWYLEQLARWDPELVAGCRPLMDRFRDELVPFETGGRYSPEALQETYVETINCLLGEAIASQRPAYLTPDAVEPGIARGLIPVPVGLAIRLHLPAPDGTPPAAPLPPVPGAGSPESIRDLASAHASGVDLKRQLAELVLEMGTRRAIYLAETGHRDEALAALDVILDAVPDYRNATIVRDAILTQLPGPGSPDQRRPRRRTWRRRSGQSVKMPSTPEEARSCRPRGSLTV